MSALTFLNTLARAYLTNAKPEILSGGVIQASRIDSILGDCFDQANEVDPAELIAMTEAEALDLAMEISSGIISQREGNAPFASNADQARESLTRLIGAIPSLIRARLRRPDCPNGISPPSGFSLGDPQILREILPKQVPVWCAGDKVELYKLVCILSISGSVESWLAILPEQDEHRVTIQFFFADGPSYQDDTFKILDQIELTDFFLAFGPASTLKAPPLPLVLDRGHTGNLPYIVSSLGGYYPLGNLRQGIDGKESLPSREIFPALLDSLELLHGLGMCLVEPRPESVWVADGTTERSPGAVFDLGSLGKEEPPKPQSPMRALAGSLLGKNPYETNPINLLIGFHSTLGFPVLGLRRVAESMAIPIGTASHSIIEKFVKEIVQSRCGSCQDVGSILSDAGLKQLRYGCGFDGRQMASFTRAFIINHKSAWCNLAADLLGIPRESGNERQLLSWLNIRLGFPPAALSCLAELMGLRVDAELQLRYQALMKLTLWDLLDQAEVAIETSFNNGILRLLRDTGRFTPDQIGEFAVALAIPTPDTAKSVACALLGIEPTSGDPCQILRMLFSNLGLNTKTLSAFAKAMGVYTEPARQGACRTFVIEICKKFAGNSVQADKLGTEDGLIQCLRTTGQFEPDQLAIFAEALYFPSEKTASRIGALILGETPGKSEPRQILGKLWVKRIFPAGILSVITRAMGLRVEPVSQSLFHRLICGVFRKIPGMTAISSLDIADILEFLKKSERFTQDQLGTFAEALHFPTFANLDGLWRRLGNCLLQPGGPQASQGGWPTEGRTPELISFLHDIGDLDWELLTKLAVVLGLELEKGRSGAYYFARKAGNTLSITFVNALRGENFRSIIHFCWVPPGECRVGGSNGIEGANSFLVRRGFWCSRQVLSYRQLLSIFGGSGVEAQLATNPVRNILLRSPVLRGQLPQYFYVEYTERVQRLYLDHPVSVLTEQAIKSIIERLNAGASYQDNGPNLRYKFRIPTSLEWEYMVRGGGHCPIQTQGFDFYIRQGSYVGPPGSTDPAYGMTLTKEILEQINLNQPNDSRHSEKLRGTIDPSSCATITNGLGLVGMHGNTWEWTQDMQVLNGVILRGGCHSTGPDEARASSWKTLQQFRPDHQGRYRDVGIRLIAEPIFP